MGAIQISALSVRDQALRAHASIPLDTINVEGGEIPLLTDPRVLTNLLKEGRFLLETLYA